MPDQIWDVRLRVVEILATRREELREQLLACAPDAPVGEAFDALTEQLAGYARASDLAEKDCPFAEALYLHLTCGNGFHDWRPREVCGSCRDASSAPVITLSGRRDFAGSTWIADGPSHRCSICGDGWAPITVDVCDCGQVCR